MDRITSRLAVSGIVFFFSAMWFSAALATPYAISTIGPTGAQPMGIAVDSNENIFVSNFSDDTVTKFDSNGNVLATYSVGTQPIAIAIDSSDNVFVANYSSNNLTKISPSGTQTTLSIAGGAGPQAIAIDSIGNIFTANTSSNDVTIIPAVGSPSIIGSTGSGPVAIAVDSSGNVYTANFSSNSVTRLSNSGSAWTATNIAVGNNPRGISINQDGHVYVSNLSASSISQILSGSSTSTVFASTSGPYGLVHDASGNLFVANYSGNTLSKITASGIVEVLGATGQFPRNVALARTGNIYTVNQSSNNVTKLARPLPTLPAKTLIVTFDTKGGSPISIAGTINGGAVTDPGTPTRDRFTFTGWNTAADGSGIPVTFPYHHTNSTDFTLYAQWQTTPLIAPTTTSPPESVVPLIPRELPATGMNATPWPLLLVVMGIALFTLGRKLQAR